MTDHGQSALTLEMVLNAKERRAGVQEQLRKEYNAVVVSMTLNMPGPVKYRPEWIGMLYDAAEEVRRACLSHNLVTLEERMLHDPAGATLLMALQGDPNEIKGIAVALEDFKPWGRLLDLDVFSASGDQVNRSSLGLPSRKCLVCEDMAAVCVRAMRHDREEVISAAMQLAKQFTDRTSGTEDSATLQMEVARKIGQLSLEAMLMEVAATPAPGLVDRFNSGAHDDMDIMTFLRSSSALSGAMTELALAGLEHEGSLPELLSKIRRIGIRAEHEMYSATLGVNTQKGLLFLLGILTAAAGYVLRPSAKALPKNGPLNPEVIARRAAEICAGLVERELEVLHHKRPDRQLTAGEHYYLAHGFTGVRGEIEAGLPSVFEAGLPRLREALNQSASDNDALVHALLGLMTHTEDTTILHRHDLVTLEKVRAEAAEILSAGGYLTPEGRQKTEALDRQYTSARISPGGSADLLAVTWFLHRMEEMFSADGQVTPKL